MYYKQVLNLKWKEFCQPKTQWTNNLKQKEGHKAQLGQNWKEDRRNG